MLWDEAKWFGQQVAKIEPAELFPMCNVGSSTRSHRTVVQPWINEFIFAPAQDRGRVLHVDIKEAPGVDLVGDITDARFLQRLRTMNFRSVFCSNLLEHINEPHVFCRTIASILPNRGLLFASCPHRYPYHPDPIDTMFRPGTTELANMFPGTTLVESKLVDEGKYLGHLSEPMRTLLLVGRGMVPIYRPKNWRLNRAYLPWIFRRVSSACVILKKASSAAH